MFNLFRCFKIQNDYVSKHKEYFENGSIKKIYYLNSDKQLSGEYKEYRENGKLWVHTFYKDDSQVGIFKIYDISGKLHHHYDYDTHTFLKIN